MNTKRLVVILFSTLLGLALIPLWMWLVGPPPVAFAVPSVYENQEVGNTSPSSTHTVCPSGIPTCGFSTVQEAVDAASDGNTIKVATGVYTGVSARNGVTQVVYISKSITVRGGYTTDFTDPPDPEANPTTLDAQDQGRVIYITGDISVTISGLNITGGDLQLEGTPPLLDYSGGGIFVITATVTLTNNHIYSNTAFRGGGFFLYNSPNAAIIKNTITGNTVTGGASRGGGGVFYLSAGGVVDENLIKNNRAEPTGGGEKHYGGIYFYNSADIVMSNNTIIDNYAANFCGGISFNNNSDNAFIFGNNFANNSSGFGGFVDADGGALCITSSMNTNILANIFTDNSSNTYGGAINISNSTVTLTGNTVVSNTASKGGGIAIQSSDVVLVGNVISGNLSSNHTHPNFNGDGGGLYIRNSEINFTNIVIADNQAERIGSGVFITDTVLHAQHTTIARNSGGDGSGIYLGNNNDTSTAVITNTILVSHTVGITVEAGNTATLNGVLWFGNTSDTGGTGAINITNDHVGNPAFAVDGYHLTDNSTAIDLGIDTNVTNDGDDEPRPMGDGYDLGADEFFVSAVVTLEVDTSSFVGFVDVYVTDTRVLATGAMTINLEALNLDGYNAASLRVYTINDPGDPGTVRQGMVGQSVPTQTVPFKVWTPNFGLGIDDDGDGAPDVDNDLNWKDITQTVWLYAFDKNEPITETVEPWNHPLFNYTDLFKWSEAYTPTPSSLNLHEPLLFALVLEGKAQPQDYSTQVYIEFALSEDLGDTFITYTVPVTLNVVLNDADPTVNLSVDTTGFTGFPD
ncbi:MAG: hypothetical protein GY796_24270, partial [Chloroflexi bacterium]|nr:hypothetical protein [Chloroflexota bacterium]